MSQFLLLNSTGFALNISLGLEIVLYITEIFSDLSNTLVNEQLIYIVI